MGGGDGRGCCAKHGKDRESPTRREDAIGRSHPGLKVQTWGTRVLGNWGIQREGNLLQCIDGQAAEELREEVSGFLRHDGAGKGDFAELFHGYRVGEESYISFAAPHLVDCFGGVTKVAEISLLADFLCVEAEEA